jgi:hypothetical protein
MEASLQHVLTDGKPGIGKAISDQCLFQVHFPSMDIRYCVVAESQQTHIEQDETESVSWLEATISLEVKTFSSAGFVQVSGLT